MLRWTEHTPSDMELDPEDNPLPPPLGRPGVGPVAAATALQGALELMSIQATRNQPGKYFNLYCESTFLTTLDVEFGRTSISISSTLLKQTPQRK